MSLNSDRGMARLDMNMLATKRAGRKRKQGRRTACGDLARPSVNYKKLAGEQPHRNWLPESIREHEKAATLLGILNLIYAPATEYSPEKGITDQQAEAGRQYAVAVGRYRASISAPSGIAGAGKGYGCNPDLCRKAIEDNEEAHCECNSRRVRYMELSNALASTRDFKAQKAVNDCAIHEQIVDIKDLRRGLDLLVSFLGLGSGSV